MAEIAPILEGKPNLTHLAEIDLEELGRKFRLQRVVFETARDLYDEIEQDWKGSKELLLAQLIQIVEKFLRSDRIEIVPPLFNQDELRRRIILTVNMAKVVHHVGQAVRFANTEALVPVFDTEHPIRSTADMRTWYTARPCERAKRSHVNFCIYDSTWEACEAFELDKNKNVAAWVKNDHIGFAVHYVYRGVVKAYWPDYIVRLKDGRSLVLEVKGRDTEENQAKRAALDEWVKAVNAHGGFGTWTWGVAMSPGEVVGLLSAKA